MVPDRQNIDRVALIQTFIVAPTFTVRPGFQVKLAGTQTNHNILEVQECTAVTDVPIGVACGVVGDPSQYVVGGSGAGVYPTTAKFQVTCYFHVVERAMAGTGGVVLGQRVAQDPASPSHGLIAAPASNPAGATLTQSPGIALATVNVDEAFPLAILPITYVST